MAKPVKKKSAQSKHLVYSISAALAAIIIFLTVLPSNSSGGGDPQQLRELIRRGRSFFEMGKIDESIKEYRRAIEIKPRSSAANLGLGISLESSSKGVDAATRDRIYHEAVNAYQTVLQTGTATEIPVAHVNLGNIYREKYNNFTGALFHFKAAIDTSSSVRMGFPFFHPYKNLGSLMEKNGYMEEAIANFEKAVEIQRRDDLKVYARLLLPYVYKSMDDMLNWRKRYERNLDNLLRDDIKIENPADSEGVPNYYLSYHGLSNVDLARKYAQLMLKAVPGLDFTSPHVRTYKKPGKTIKIGFVSYYFRDHSVTKMIAGLLKKLKDNSRFETVLFYSGQREDESTRLLQMMTNKYIKLPGNELGAMRNMIAMEQLDIVVYAEIGMDPNSYSLAHARLAPVQLAMHGHADTTGIPNIDYYVTYAGFDERKFDHYSEHVIRVEGHTMLPLYYDMKPFRADDKLWQPSERAALRAKYNIPRDAFVFGCLQTLFKLTPHMDSVMKQILEKVPNAVILLKELPMTDKVGQFLQARLKGSLGEDLAKRVIFLPPLSDNDYRNVFPIVDVILDSFPFGGHTSSMDAFANNLPVVTLPSDLLSGRCTLGFLRMLEAPDLIAQTEDEYISIAVRLAKDSRYLAEVKKRLKANWPALIKDQTSVKSWEKMLVAVATKSNLHNFVVS